ncbi:hypothetical protein HOK021_22140 [Streptomyces hygroscopicus]|nr:hypothetical protein HOK021_22140 [Streptomyces hygroscopicus]
MRDGTASQTCGDGTGDGTDREHPEFGHRGYDERNAQSYGGDQPPHPWIHGFMVDRCGGRGQGAIGQQRGARGAMTGFLPDRVREGRLRAG